MSMAGPRSQSGAPGEAGGACRCAETADTRDPTPTSRFTGYGTALASCRLDATRWRGSRRRESAPRQTTHTPHVTRKRITRTALCSVRCRRVDHRTMLFQIGIPKQLSRDSLEEKILCGEHSGTQTTRRNLARSLIHSERAPATPLELNPCFYLGSIALTARWGGRRRPGRRSGRARRRRAARGSGSR